MDIFGDDGKDSVDACPCCGCACLGARGSGGVCTTCGWLDDNSALIFGMSDSAAPPELSAARADYAFAAQSQAQDRGSGGHESDEGAPRVSGLEPQVQV